jgi:alanyl-tRNA synthetase
LKAQVICISAANFFPKHLSSQGVTAEQWAASVSEVVGGRAGGKEPSRQGQGTKPENIDDGVETATKWLSEKLKL